MNYLARWLFAMASVVAMVYLLYGQSTRVVELKLDASTTTPTPPVPPASTDNSSKPNYTRDASIGHVVSELLQHGQYLRKPLDLEISKRWLKNYLDTLDPLHFIFLQSDIDEFTTKYASPGDNSNLCGLLLHGETDEAAISPAFEIRKRYVERLTEAVTLVKNCLKQTYDFHQQDSYPVQTEKSDWFKDHSEFELYWRTRVKDDLLKSLLAKALKNNGKLSDADTAITQETINKLNLSYTMILSDNMENHSESDTLQDYIDALCHSFDPHTDYFPPEEAKQFQQTVLDLYVVGIGARLQSVDGYPTVEEVVPGGPAKLDNRLKAGDRVVAVGQGETGETVSTIHMPVDKVVNLVRGRRGTLVKLVVIPLGANDDVRKEIIIKRDKIVLEDEQAKADIIEHLKSDGEVDHIGVIKLPGFYAETGDDVHQLLVNLQDKYKLDGVILDLRTDGGGALDQALKLTGLFTSSEPVVQVRYPNEVAESLYTDGTQTWDGPLIVMVNKKSASASEIVAGALQDYGRALIVGDKSTHGKGSVQKLIDMNPMRPFGFSGDLGMLKMTVQKFYRVAGTSTQLQGVVPDIILPSRLDALALGETELSYPLPHDTIDAVKFTNYDEVASYLPDLKKSSMDRVASSADFKILQHDVDFEASRLAEKSLSLNIDARLKDQNDIQDTWAKESADINARKNQQDKLLEWTLTQIQHNEPPAPLEKKHYFTEDEDVDANDPFTDPTFDPQLFETVSIMSDYIIVLKAGAKDPRLICWSYRGLSS